MGSSIKKDKYSFTQQSSQSLPLIVCDGQKHSNLVLLFHHLKSADDSGKHCRGTNTTGGFIQRGRPCVAASQSNCTNLIMTNGMTRDLHRRTTSFAILFWIHPVHLLFGKHRLTQGNHKTQTEN